MLFSPGHQPDRPFIESLLCNPERTNRAPGRALPTGAIYFPAHQCRSLMGM
ncbi:hypothetical protein HMPREF3193_00541 [Bifidobacterium breve]|nr:hypothetical protein HMPREF3193_00541 [Bifidobacterium breve]